MDKYIETMAVYWADWQYTAIANTRYSVVLFVLAFLVGWFAISLLKSVKISKLKQQLEQEKELSKQIEQKFEELSEQQKKEVAQLADAQQQLEKALAEIQKTKAEHLALIASKDESFLKLSQDKDLEIKTLNATVKEKNQQVEQLKSEVDEQIASTDQYASARHRIAELEQQASESTTQLSAVKQQLQAELNNKDSVAEQLKIQEDIAKDHMDKAVELEGQMEGINNSIEIAADSEESVVEPAMDAEDPVQVEQIAETILESNQEPEVIKQETGAETETVAEEVKPDKVVEDKTNGKQGVVGGMMGWFQSIDKRFEKGRALESDEKEVDDISGNDERLVENLSEKISIKTESKAFEETPVADSLLVKQRSNNNGLADDDDDSSFSEKLGEVADRMDAFQEKFKGFFNR